MHVPQRLWAVGLFAALGLLALAFAGLLDWITSVLFLGLEFVAERLRPALRRDRASRQRGPAPGHGRAPAVASASVSASPSWREHLRRRPLRKGRPRRELSKTAAIAPAGTGADPSSSPRARILVPLSADRPELIAFALEECLGRRAELLVLFLRPLAVTPMGPAPLPCLEEDGPARALFERVGTQARDAGVPFRTLYRVVRDLPGAILDVARGHEADVVLMEATRRNLLWRALMGDEVRAVLMHLPRHVNLLIHAP